MAPGCVEVGEACEDCTLVEHLSVGTGEARRHRTLERMSVPIPNSHLNHKLYHKRQDYLTYKHNYTIDLKCKLKKKN